MASLAQRIYWWAPYFAKCWMASLNARRQDRWRYGASHESMVPGILERANWPAERMAEYRDEQLRKMIRHAADRVPYYQKLFADYGIDPESIRTVEDLRRIPILDKEAIRTDSVSFVDKTLDRSKLLVSHTSGTTGKALELYATEETCSAAFAYTDVRRCQMGGMQRRRNRSVCIGVYHVSKPGATKPPFWVVNRHWDQMYMSCYHLYPKYLPHYVEALRDWRPEYFSGYPSAMYAIAKFIVDSGAEPVPMKVCYSTAETLYDFQREAIEKAFACRVYNHYGCSEMIGFAMECPEGSMHVSPDFGVIEICDENGAALPPGQIGHIIGTTLTNFTQPFIRYRVGDMGALKEGSCACGSPLPLLAGVEGRIDDSLILKDGRHVGRLDPVFKDTYEIVEAQIVQDTRDDIRIRVVPGKQYTAEVGARAKANLEQYIGTDHNIRVEEVSSIERTAAGKYKVIVCNLPPDQRR